jgi:hypothetical protein
MEKEKNVLDEVKNGTKSLENRKMTIFQNGLGYHISVNSDRA